MTVDKDAHDEDAIKLPFTNSRCPDQVPQLITTNMLGARMLTWTTAAVGLVCLANSSVEASRRVLRANCPDYDGSETSKPVSTSQASTSGSYDEVIKASSAFPGGSASSDASASDSGEVTVQSLTTSPFSSAAESTASDPEEVSVETLSLASSASEESEASELDETTVDTPEPTTGSLPSAASTASGSAEVSVGALSLASSASDSNDVTVDTPDPTTATPTSTSWESVVTLYSEKNFGGSSFEVTMSEYNRCYVLDCFENDEISATWDSGLPSEEGDDLAFFASADCNSNDYYNWFGTFYFSNVSTLLDDDAPPIKAIALWVYPYDDPANPVSTCPARL